MEQFMLTRLQQRRARLMNTTKEAETMLMECRGTGVQVDDFNIKQLQLKQNLEAFSHEVHKFKDRSENFTKVTNEDLGLEIQMRAEDLLLEMDTISRQNTKALSLADQESSTRLPKLTLPKFDGDILKWTEFWDNFEANVHTKHHLKDVDKLAYLMGSMEGKARDTLSGLCTTNQNYEVAVRTLTERYGAADRVIDGHYKALSRLNQCGYSAIECRENLDAVEKHLRVLKSLGEGDEGNHLRSLILEKIPERVLYEVSVLSKGDKSVKNIRSSLEIIVAAMEQSQTETSICTPVASTQTLFSTTLKKPNAMERKPPRHSSRQAKTGLKRQRPKETETRGNSKNRSKRTRRSCIFCDGQHYNDECDVVRDLKERKNKLKNRCFNCFMGGHQVKNCKITRVCHHCSGKHNRALCHKKLILGENLKRNEVLSTDVLIRKCVNTRTYLQTVRARVHHNNSSKPCRILLDSGSQRSYMTTEMTKRLDLIPKHEALLMIYTFGAQKPIETVSPCTNILIETKRGVQKSIQVNIIPHITDRVPISDISRAGLVDIVADDESVGLGIDILIGNDYYHSFMRDGKIKIDTELYLVDSDFGWFISGHSENNTKDKENILSVITYHQSNCECSCYTEPDLPLKNQDIKFLWTLENIGITDSIKATREEEAVQHFNKTVQYHSGRYFIKWPWIQYPPDIPTNYGLAYGRLKGLLQRSNEATLQEYDEILKEQLEAEIIEIVEVNDVTTSQTIPPVHYLPHHMVKQSGKRGRIVYDASAKLKRQQSLNECLYRGPCMLQDLTALLLNFRIHKIGIVADVEKAFLQVGLQTEDRDVTRFLWVKDFTKPLSSENMLHLRFCRVSFGIISSPFLLTAVICNHVSKENSHLIKHMANKCYVDNVVTGADTTQEAISLFRETRDVFQRISMNLRDWTSNDEAFLNKIPEQFRAETTEEVKVLGLLWNKKEDTLSLKVSDETFKEDHNKLTKRKVLKVLASVYDPCGFVSPVLLPVKLFLQELWRRDYKWDTPLSQELEMEWKSILSNLEEVKNVVTPRHVGANVRNGTKYEIHCFSDASKKSYAAVAYLRVVNGPQIQTTLLMSKNRIVPLERIKKAKPRTQMNEDTPYGSESKKKPLTIPQLELLGCSIGNRLLTYLKQIITLPDVKQFLWTDSLVVLNWIMSNKLLPPFVGRRVEEIKQNSSLKMYYINTEQNPADIATRPELWAQKKELWFRGPKFLGKHRNAWPRNIHLEDHQVALTLTTETCEEVPEIVEVSPHSKEIRTDNPIHTTDIVETRSYDVQEIKKLQSDSFPDEMKGKETHLTRNLGIFTDIDGLLRCTGRMMNANWAYDMKHPILLPKDCAYTVNLIRETHEKNYHVGVSHTLSILRQQFWIPQGRTQVQKVLRRCPQCVKHGGGPYPLPETPALPPERVTYDSPFTYTGLDYFGPMITKVSTGKEKRWICLFTCLAVRAVHLEVVQDLTADECLLALRRFISARGVPTFILSDNALQFRLTSEVMTKQYCIQNKIRWKFTPQLAPWHGGVYERLVAVVKHCLKRTLEKYLLNDSQLQTVMKEVEAVVNTRPLTHVGADIEYVLKPADFLSLGKCLVTEQSDKVTLPEGTGTKRNLVSGWRRGQNIVNDFKEMFIGQYLSSLRERYSHRQKQPRVKTHKSPCVGDLVQIKGETKSRQNWKVGRISSLIMGPDGECRVAKVKVGETEFTRSIGHLYPLEAELEQDSGGLTRSKFTGDTVIEMTEVEPSRFSNPMETDLIVDIPDLVAENNTARNNVTMEVEREGEKATDGEVQSNRLETALPIEVEMENVHQESEETLETEPTENREDRGKRVAAIRAREKIAEWTRQLVTLL